MTDIKYQILTKKLDNEAKHVVTHAHRYLPSYVATCFRYLSSQQKQKKEAQNG